MDKEENKKFEQQLKRDIESGTWEFMSPWYDYRVPQDIQVDEVMYKGIFFDLLKPGDNYQSSLSLALEGVRSLDDHLKDVNFFPDEKRRTPEVQVEVPTCLHDLETPVLGSYTNFPRVILKPVRGLGTLHSLSGKVSYEVREDPTIIFVSADEPCPGIRPPFEVYNFSNLNYKLSDATLMQSVKYNMLMNGDLNFQRKGKKKRGIKTIANPNLEVRRSPIVINTDPENRVSRVNKFAGLAYEILLNQLEPSITTKMLGAIKKIGYNISEQEYNGVANRINNEGRLIGRAIIREWLLAINGKRFNREEIDKWKDHLPAQEREKSALSQVGLRGPSEVVDFYRSPGWDLDKFLQGKF